MKREIKFRAWTGIQMENWNHIKTWETLAQHLDGLTEFKWMQYTGLKDKNGKEIYEGDVFRYELLNDNEKEFEQDSTIYTEAVHFVDGCFELDNCPLGAFYYMGEVIGNIYENPELLTNK